MIKLKNLTGLLGMVLLILATSSVQGQSKAGYFRLMQGPVLGAVDETSALIWVRGSYSFPVTVQYSTDPDMMHEPRTATRELSKDNDYCAVIPLEDLKPNTRYYYRILIEDKPDRYLKNQMPYSLKTAPTSSFKGKFRVAFGSCARFQMDQHQVIWETISRYDPDLFLWLGDNIYGDSLDADILAEEYRRQREIPDLKRFMAMVPQLAIWDDHDYGLNNHDRRNPVKADMLEVFKRYWPNPEFGQVGNPGIYFSYSFGDVDFFFLDGRYYRDPNKDPDSPTKTQLGKVQVDWLRKRLVESEATFKVLVSGGGWSGAKGEGTDSWGAHMTERDRLFDFIRDEEITGVVLISGDTHFAELNAIPRADQGGYDLYDLVSSPLAQRAFTSWLLQPYNKRVRFPFSQSANFGIIDFDLEAGKLTFNVIGDDGGPIWEPFVLHAHELVNGQGSWEAKTSMAARQWNAIQR